MGLVVRFRHKELAVMEVGSLYHLNRELKMGRKGKLDKLA